MACLGGVLRSLNASNITYMHFCIDSRDATKAHYAVDAVHMPLNNYGRRSWGLGVLAPRKYVQ